MPASTLLGLDLDDSDGEFTLPLYASRGIQMTLEPIEAAAHIERDINGNLINLANTQFQKYQAKCSCDDQDSPAFALADSNNVKIWPGMEFVVTCLPHLGAPEPIELRMMVRAWQIARNEWGAATSWSLDLEEV